LASATSTTSTSTADPTTTSTTQPTVGQQAFAAYEHAFDVIAEIEGDPTGRSTDPRLQSILINPWLTQIVSEINLFRLRDQIVKGTVSFTNFELTTVTGDGRVIFTDCQVNGQAVHNAKTGLIVGNDLTQRLAEQVVVYHPSANVWQVADDNAVTSGSAAICNG
jgi:hypothetical protein